VKIGGTEIMEKTEFAKLPEVVFPSGTGIPDLTARLVNRDGRLCLYERSDNVWEVFWVKEEPAAEAFGRSYPAREVYPGNEDFGRIAWCYSSEEVAKREFRRLLEWRAIRSSVTVPPNAPEISNET
jgi:hypothetical protein